MEELEMVSNFLKRANDSGLLVECVWALLKSSTTIEADLAAALDEWDA